MLQYFVSSSVSMDVVDLLEAVQIQVYERHRAALGGIDAILGRLDAIRSRKGVVLTAKMRLRLRRASCHCDRTDSRIGQWLRAHN
jgi:hypothetical protein